VNPAARLLPALILFGFPALSHPAWSQEWRASARVGRVTYDGAPTGASGASSAVLSLGRTGLRDWLGASAALPLGDDPFWAVLGGWKRLQAQGRFGALLDLSGQGFIQRQTTTTAPSPGPLLGPLVITRTDLSGEGASGEVMAGGFAGSSSIRLESRAGVGAQRSSLGGVLQERALPTVDARLTVVRSLLTLQGESRGWLDDSVTHVYAGGAMQLERGPVRMWGSLGGWMQGGRDGIAWSVGASTAIAPQTDLQLGGRGNAFDPLYSTSTATSFWGGISVRLGGNRTAQAPVPRRLGDGRTVIRIPASSTKGTPSIAGDFTGWKPVPMERDGSHWTFKAVLRPGVYHYAFVREDGAWFVPASVPGRQSDGMGGVTAVLVVP
jgi:hypothetical protein